MEQRESLYCESPMKKSTGFRSTFDKDIYPQTSIEATKNVTYYDRIPMRKELPKWNSSAAVLRNSHPCYSFPHDTRFKSPEPNYYDHNKLIQKSTLGNRTTTMGLGKKVNVPEIFNHNKGQATSGCPFYEVDGGKLRRNQSQVLKKGKTIGCGWNSYEKARTPHRSTVHSTEQIRQNPGMKYQLSQKTGNRANKIKIHERLRMFTDMAAHSKQDEPGPQMYNINEKHVKTNRPQCGMGSGKKSDFTLNPQKSAIPGPIYSLSGFCDKYTKTKFKNLGSQFR